MAINLSDFITTKTSNTPPNDLEQDIVSYVESTRKAYESARSSLVDIWRMSWAAYIGTTQALEDTRRSILQNVGTDSSWWRHRISTGKAFESVESIVAYMTQATFPTEKWFSLEPTNPNQREEARLVEAYIRDLLKDINFKSAYQAHLRQLVVTGTSTLALPWRNETIPMRKKVKTKIPMVDETGAIVGEHVKWDVKMIEKTIKDAPQLEVIDVFDTYLDPTSTNANEGNFIRRLHKRRSDLVRGAANGFYQISTLDAMQLSSSRPATIGGTPELTSWEGVRLDAPVTMGDVIYAYEFWGDIDLAGVTFHDVVALVAGGKLLSFYTNPFWCGRPFVTGSYINLARQPYSIGAVQPSLGLLQEMNIITNARLDNVVINSHGAFKAVEDGVLNIEDVVISPGGIIPVGDINNLVPIAMPTAHNVTYQETQVIEARIDANFGTPSIISNGQVRSGERVTATEIEASRNAGGNRLTNVFDSVEQTSLLPILNKIVGLCKQFVTGDRMVKVTGLEADTKEYYMINEEEFQYDYGVKAMGAEYVVAREKAISDRTQLMQIMSSNPEMAAVIDFTVLAKDILQQFGFDDPDMFLKEDKQGGANEGTQPTGQLTNSPQPQTPVNPQQGVANDIQALGGDNLSEAVKAQIMAQGNPNQFYNDVMGGQATQPQQPLTNDFGALQ